MIRSLSELKNRGLRNVLNHVYYEMIGLCIMYKDYEYSSYAAKYAKDTIKYSNFNTHKLNGTDLYNLFVYLNKLSEQSKINKKDEILMKRAKLDIDFYVRYLRRMINGSLSVVEFDSFMKRITKDLYIEDNILRSIGRMAINWNRLTLRERKLTLDKMKNYGTVKFRYSEVTYKIREFASEFKVTDEKSEEPVSKSEPVQTKPEGMSNTEKAMYALGGLAAYKFLQKKREKQQRIRDAFKKL